MSKFLLLSKFNGNKALRQRRPRSRKSKLSAKWTKLFVISLLIVFGVYYLVETNQVSTLGFELRELQDRTEELKVQNDKMQIEAAQLKSMKRIEEESQELNLVAGGVVQYLDASTSEVAAR